MGSTHTLPGLDEATFQQMLEAAYVLQERRKQPALVRRKTELGAALAEIAATQEVLHSKEWDLRTSSRLIAEQLQKITNAAGVAVAVLHEAGLEYYAAVGTTASLAGMSAPIDSGMSEFLEIASADPVRIGELIKRQSAESPFLFPVYNEGKVAGLLDVRFGECDFIPEQEVQSCQVMAGLMGQAIASATKLEWKHALASERATMLDVLEKLRPQLERLALEPEEGTEPPAELQDETSAPGRERSAPEIEALLLAMSQAAEKDGTGASCAQCGYQFGDRELFCGRCGTPRLMSAKPEDLNLAPPSSEPAVEPAIATANESNHNPELNQYFPADASMLPPTEPIAIQSFLETPATDGSLAFALSASEETAEAEQIAPAETGMAGVAHEDVQQPNAPIVAVPAQEQSASPATWSSAAQALQWLKSMDKANSPERIWLAKHRGDISIVLAGMVLLLALTGWGLHPGSGLSQSQPRLTLFERMLVSLGVAEAPPPPVAAGNPNVWVWVDVHTALYYCPGADLYGKTAGGKFVLQREAQIDEFQPAERASCK